MATHQQGYTPDYPFLDPRFSPSASAAAASNAARSTEEEETEEDEAPGVNGVARERRRKERDLLVDEKDHADRTQRSGTHCCRDALGAIVRFLRPVYRCVRHLILRFGEDWIFLFILGISMATISYCLDVVIGRFQRINLHVYDSLENYRVLQYFSWVLYHVILMVGSAGVAQLISQQAIGSGIPEIKVSLRGVVLEEFFTLKTMVAKLIGITCTLAAGSTIFLGKVGPFVHMSCILATQFGRLIVKFAGKKENEGRKYEMIVAGAAVGVACCFVAPVGGVLFSVETTATHFAVRNYWRGFFAATCAALMFRLLAITNGEKETVAVLFTTSYQVEFPFDLPEYFSFAILGVLCGCLCCVYLFCHRNLLIFMMNNKTISQFMANNKVLYSGVLTLILASITFPHGFGQYIGSRLTMKEHLATFFDNRTWGIDSVNLSNVTLQPPNPTYHDQWLQWTHTGLTSLHMLAMFAVFKFFMLILATTLPVPAGYFLPVFVYGAGLGRLYGELMAKMFPDGIIAEGVTILIHPSAYALAGAAAYSGAVTHTLSTAVLVFELSGQMSHILPVLIAVLIANAISQRLQPSFFDGIIIVKKLPFMPMLAMGKTESHDVMAEDFMTTDVKYVTKESTYKDVKDLLMKTKIRVFPLVDSNESRVLLGSIKRMELIRLVGDQLSSERRLEHLRRRLLAEHASGEEQQHDYLHEVLYPCPSKRGRPQRRRSDLLPGKIRMQRSMLDDRSGSKKRSMVLLSGEDIIPRPSDQFESKKVKLLLGDGHAILESMTDEEIEEWERQQLEQVICLDGVTINPAPYRIIQTASLHKVYDLFNLLGLRICYVTALGKLVGVVSLKELKQAVGATVKGNFVRTVRRNSKVDQPPAQVPGADSSGPGGASQDGDDISPEPETRHRRVSFQGSAV
ncbi:chloride channel protein ClC-Kb-like isoform X1 [Lampetra planeri]